MNRDRSPRIGGHVAFFGFLFGLAFFMIFAVTFYVNAQENEPSDEEITSKGITFPVPELGNCGDKAECKAYCDDAKNIESCVAFAEKHGLMNEKESARARQFGKKVLEGGGPGGCKGPRECDAYCSSLDHIEACVAFAEEHGVEDEHIKEGRKILKHIREGGTLPGGCNSKESCDAYCSNVDHAEECIAFAEKVGFDEEMRGDIPKGVDPREMMRKFAELVRSGETPGGCRSKDRCEAYCREEGNFETCLAFGKKMGFVDERQEELFRQTGGRGPGGCNSETSCNAYCNDSSHQEECFKFAEEHNLIPKEELERAKEGMTRMRAGLEQAPPEVQECLKSVLGPNIIEDIQAGRLTPGPGIGERMRGCFEKFGEKHDFKEVFRDAPPEVIACVKEKVGAEVLDRIRSGEGAPSPEMGDAFRVCFESSRFEDNRHGDSGQERRGPSPSEFLKSAPPGIAVCIKEKLGNEFERFASGDAPPPADLESRMRECFESFRPEGAMPGKGEREHPRQFPPDGSEDRMRPGGEPFGDSSRPPFPVREGEQRPPLPSQNALFPDAVKTCLRESVSVEVFEKVARGDQPPADVEAQIKKCFENIRNVLPQPFPSPDQPSFPKEPEGSFVPRPFPVPDESKICAQVITPATNLETKECKEFPTPCDVPSGWMPGCAPQG